MEKLHKTVRYSKLLEIYKSLLTPTQIEVMEDYYLYDLSYSEIAQNRDSSRAAVEDAIKKGMNKLDEYEEKLQLLAKRKMITSLLDEIKNNQSEEVKEKIEIIKRSV